MRNQPHCNSKRQKWTVQHVWVLKIALQHSPKQVESSCSLCISFAFLCNLDAYQVKSGPVQQNKADLNSTALLSSGKCTATNSTPSWDLLLSLHQSSNLVQFACIWWEISLISTVKGRNEQYNRFGCRKLHCNIVQHKWRSPVPFASVLHSCVIWMLIKSNQAQCSRIRQIWTVQHSWVQENALQPSLHQVEISCSLCTSLAILCSLHAYDEKSAPLQQ